MKTILKTLLTTVVLSTATLTGASAATFDATSVTTNGNAHSFWFAGNPFGASAYWQFEGGAGTLEVDNNTATLSGSIVQNNATQNKFDVNVSFNLAAGPSSAGIKCGAFGNNAYCNNVADGTTTVAASLFDGWSHYTFGSATLEGVSGVVDGLDLALSDRTGRAIGQLGWGASDKRGKSDGFSDWFNWTVTNNDSGLRLTSTSGSGDINVFIAPIPLPAGGVLLLSGLFGLGAMSRRRKT